MFEIEVFSNPVMALVGEGGLLTELYLAAQYDESLIKPALLLADRVTLKTHRADLILNEKRDHRMINWPVPLTARYRGISSRRDPEEWRMLGLDERDLLTEAELERYASVHESGAFDGEPAEDEREALWQEFVERAEPYRLAIMELHRAKGLALESKALRDLSERGLLEESPWDQTPKTRPQQIIDNLTGENAEFERAFLSMAAEVANSPKSVMFDDAVGSRITQSGPQIGGMDSALVVAGAVDLMRMVEGVTELPIDEVADIRDELSTYIQPFRAFMLEIASNVNFEGLSDAERARELKLAWEREVEPAISDMRAHVEGASFRRNAIDVFSNSAETLQTVGMAIGIAGVAGFTGLSTLTAAGAAAPPILKAFMRSIRAKQDVKRNRAYFVHAMSRIARERRSRA